MDIATLRSSYNAALEAYENSVRKISFWRKCTYVILIVGAPVTAFLLGEAFFSLRSLPDYWSRENHLLWEKFALDIFIALCAIFCSWLAIKVRPAHAFPAPLPDDTEEQFYEAALSNTSEEVDEYNALIHQQKRLLFSSLGLFLASDLMFAFL